MADEMVSIPLYVARLINVAYLPANPHKLRSAAPEVKDAVIKFKAALAEACRTT